MRKLVLSPSATFLSGQDTFLVATSSGSRRLDPGDAMLFMRWMNDVKLHNGEVRANPPQRLMRTLRSIRFIIQAREYRRHSIPYRCTDREMARYVAIASKPSLEGPFILNPAIRRATVKSKPARQLLAGSVRTPLWITDPVTDVCFPLWASEETVRLIQKLKREPEKIEELGEKTFLRLYHSRILIEAARVKPAFRREFDRRHARELKKTGYTVIRDFLPPPVLVGIRAYHRALLDKKLLPYGDLHVEDRFFHYNGHVKSFFHEQYAGLARRLAGSSYEPSFSYYISYGPRSQLKKHLDRPECELSVTTLVDYEPESTPRERMWPIYIHPPRQKKASKIHLGLTDAIFYYGHKLPHYRHRIPSGHQSASMLLFYIKPQRSRSR